MSVAAPWRTGTPDLTPLPASASYASRCTQSLLRLRRNARTEVVATDLQRWSRGWWTPPARARPRCDLLAWTPKFAPTASAASRMSWLPECVSNTKISSIARRLEPGMTRRPPDTTLVLSHRHRNGRGPSRARRFMRATNVRRPAPHFAAATYRHRRPRRRCGGCGGALRAFRTGSAVAPSTHSPMKR
jgi:hypothetical protein